MTAARERLPNRRASENFSFELDGLRFTASVSRFADGRISELFINNHKAGNQSDTNARDAAIIFSFAVQHGADADAIRRALCRDSNGKPLSPIGTALDLLVGCEP
jgi:ribonucleoside-diphosphate reductase alpha chain